MPFRRYGNVYRCFYCHLNFQLANDLKQHYKEHEEIYLRKAVKRCPLRQAVKLDISDLKCKQCGVDFTSLRDLLAHLNDAHDEKCSVDHEAHVDCFKLADGHLKCLICEDTFSFFGPLLLHTLRSHKRKRIICEICGQSFATTSSINRHNQSAHTTNSYKCRHCDKKFLAIHRRDDHEKRIHNVKERKCHICGEILGSTYKRDSHLAAVHDFKTSEFKCEMCPKVFRFQNQLVKHNKRVHLKEKTKVCDVCGDKFFDNHLLGLHKVKHSDAKPFECGVCYKKFPRKRALDIHTRIHTNDRRFVCKLCGKAFVQTTSLKLHLRVHHGEEKK